MINGSIAPNRKNEKANSNDRCNRTFELAFFARLKKQINLIHTEGLASIGIN